MAILRSRAYIRLLVVAAILGVPISAAAYGFLALVNYLQQELFIHLPHGLGLSTVPAWWPLPILVIGGVLAALAIRYLPGNGGASPAPGFGVHPPPTPVQLPGVILAALASLAFGAVIGPEMPLIALGGGLAVLATKAARRRPVPPQGVTVLGASGAFAALSTLLGSPISSAFLLMEAAGLGGPTMGLVLVPGLLASGVGALIFIGLDSLTGLGTFSLAIPSLPPFGRPDVAEFGWAIVIGLAAALLGPAILRMCLSVQRYAEKRVMIVLPLAGLAVAVLTIIYTQATGKPSSDVLFSGQSDMGPLVDHAASYSVGTLLLLLVCKTLTYGVSRGSFRGGPIFPALFIGTAGGVAMSHLPGLPLVAAVAMGIGAMMAATTKLPLTSVLIACLLMLSDAEALIAVARAQVAARDPEAASQTLAGAGAAILDGAPDHVRLEARLVEAAASYRRGDCATGRKCLAQALKLAEREHVQLPFALERAWIQPVLRQDSRLAEAFQRAFATSRTRVDRGQKCEARPGTPPAVVDSLSGRELEVLRHVSSLESNSEIAEAMYLSIHTVKTHIRHILNKLGVQHRAEAVRMARRLQLL